MPLWSGRIPMQCTLGDIIIYGNQVNIYGVRLFVNNNITSKLNLEDIYLQHTPRRFSEIYHSGYFIKLSCIFKCLSLPQYIEWILVCRGDSEGVGEIREIVRQEDVGVKI